MQEPVFKELLGLAAVREIRICPGPAFKGKPARQRSTTESNATIWRVLIGVGQKDEFLEAARGGPREWASLDRLVAWLRDKGVKQCILSVENSEFSAAQRPLPLTYSD